MWLRIPSKISYRLSAVNWCCSALCAHLVFREYGQKVAEDVSLRFRAVRVVLCTLQCLCPSWGTRCCAIVPCHHGKALTEVTSEEMWWRRVACLTRDCLTWRVPSGTGNVAGWGLWVLAAFCRWAVRGGGWAGCGGGGPCVSLLRAALAGTLRRLTLEVPHRSRARWDLLNSCMAVKRAQKRFLSKMLTNVNVKKKTQKPKQICKQKWTISCKMKSLRVWCANSVTGYEMYFFFPWSFEIFFQKC